MSKELIINASLPEIRICLLDQNKIQDLIIERATGRGVVGNIYKGRVTRVLPGMQAAFVDIGLDKAAFLYVDDVVLHAGGDENGDSDDRGGESGEGVRDGDGEGDEQILDVAGGEDASGDASASGAEGEIEGHEDLLDEDLSFDSRDSSDADEAHDAQDAQDSQDSEDARDAGEEGTGGEPGSDPDDDGRPVEMADAPEDSGGSGDGDSSEKSPEKSDGKPEKPTGKKSYEGREGRRSFSRGRSRHSGGGSGGGGRHRRSRYPQRDVPVTPQSTANNEPDNTVESLQGMPDAIIDEAISNVPRVSDREDLTALEDPEGTQKAEAQRDRVRSRVRSGNFRREFRQRRGNNRRIRSSISAARRGGGYKIEDLLKEGQEVIVQVAKEPIANKGARLTCHVSLPGRHLVCMPTIDHVGVSRRIENDYERRRLRQFVEQERPSKMGFIVRTASHGQDTEKYIMQDMKYLSQLWEGIREEGEKATAPAMIYEDLNPVLRAIRDWATDDVDRIIVDSRYFYEEMGEFANRFMPSLGEKIELYHGDIPIFDAYGVSTELHRALERRVWLKSGGYIVIDQAEALVAIDVNTGRYVGKKNLEDTILKTNLEAVEEIAYQLRLRNCGGIIIIDLIDMEKEENRFRVLRTLEAALAKDRARPTIIRMTELGLIEMTRKRTRDTLVRLLCQTCNHCEGRGFVKSKTTIAYDVLREIERVGINRDVQKILVQAHPEVIDVLAIQEAETLDILEKRFKKEILLQSVEDFHLEQFNVVSEETYRKNNRNQPQRNFRQQKGGQQRLVIQPRREGGPGGAGVGGENGEPQEARPIKIIARERPLVEPGNADGAGFYNAQNPGTSGEGTLPENQDLTGMSESEGNLHFDGEATGIIKPQNSGLPPGMADMDEEDRLAYLRAQAAQDAALANREDPANGNTPARRPSGPHRANNRRGRHSGGGAGGGGRGQNRHGGGHNKGRSNHRRPHQRPRFGLSRTAETGEASAEKPAIRTTKARSEE